MSQLPRPGGGGIPTPKVVKSTSTRSMNIPGTSKTVTQTQTTITEIQPCLDGGGAGSVSRGPSASGRCPPPAPCGGGGGGPSPRPAGRGLRPPGGSMLRPPSTPGGRGSGSCGAGTGPSPGPPIASSSAIGSGLRPPSTPGLRPPGTPGLRPPSTPGLRPPSTPGLRPPSTSGLRPPATPGSRPAGSQGMPPPSTPAQRGGPCGTPSTGLRPPGGPRPPSAPGLRPPSTPGLRPPSTPGLRPPSTPGLRPPSTPGLRPPSASKAGSPCGGPCGAGAGGTPQRGRPGGMSGLRPPGAGGPRPGPSGLRPPGGPPPKALEATIEEEVQKDLLNQSAMDPERKVTAKAGKVSREIPQIVICTPGGPEPVIQQAVLERRVERDEEGERIVKNLTIVDVDQRTGKTKQIEMGMQQLDPKFARDEGKEVIGIISKVSITPSYTTVSQECTRATTEPVAQAANMTMAEIADLVEQEKEDVDNTLKMLPPDLELKPGKIEMKKRLQNLRLNSESMALLEQSIIHPEPEADEAQAEPTPEMMASMMHTVEKGVPPQSAPEQVFHSLFTETTNEQFIQLSSVAQGPLQDVVVPTEIAYDVHKEVACGDIEVLTEKLQNISVAEDIPYVDIFDRVMEEEQKSPTKGKNKEKSFQPIGNEASLWVNTNLEHLVNVVGAEPIDVLTPANLEELETSGTLEEELATGIEYFVDVDAVQYLSRVQLRGTQEPNYFPGYLVALPEFPEIIKLARSPDEVFASAWKSAQPKYFPDESMQSMVF